MTTTAWSDRAAERFLEHRPRRKTLTVATLPHSRDGSSYYRIWLPFDHLKRNSLHNYANIAEDPQTPDVPDVTVLQRPAGTGGLQLVESLVGQTRIVYEVDDDMLQVDPSGLPHLNDERAKESIRRCVRMCDMVTTTNQHLADTLSPYCEHIEILPNYVKAGLLDLHRPRRDRVTVGWAGGTSHLIDMVDIEDVLKQLVVDHPDIDLHSIGYDFSPLLRDLRYRCRRTNWQQDVGRYYKNIDFDIAVAPSADVPFNRSKTPIRALEMAALGIPIVAQNRLPYSEFVQDGVTGFLVDTDTDWSDRLGELIGDENLRAELGANARRQAADWTIEKNWPRWEAAYEKAASL
jgi:glycosyltransferase involved in cell wall biosynthesis